MRVHVERTGLTDISALNIKKKRKKMFPCLRVDTVLLVIYLKLQLHPLSQPQLNLVGVNLLPASICQLALDQMSPISSRTRRAALTCILISRLGAGDRSF
jgi:hypothetical protein